MLQLLPVTWMIGGWTVLQDWLYDWSLEHALFKVSSRVLKCMLASFEVYAKVVKYWNMGSSSSFSWMLLSENIYLFSDFSSGNS